LTTKHYFNEQTKQIDRQKDRRLYVSSQSGTLTLDKPDNNGLVVDTATRIP